MIKEKLSEEDYKLAEEVIKPIYHNAVKNDYSFAKYGVECYLAGYNKANEWHYVKDGDLPKAEAGELVAYVEKLEKENAEAKEIIKSVLPDLKHYLWLSDEYNKGQREKLVKRAEDFIKE